MDYISEILNNAVLLERVIIYLLLAMVSLLGVLTAIYASKSDKYQKLYNYTNKEARLLARLKNTYEKELKTFANLMDEITFPIWQRDKNLNIVYCNTRFCEITGEIRENIIRNSNIELFRDNKEISARAMKTGQVQVVEQNIIISGSNVLSQVVEIPISDKTSDFGAKNGTIGFALNLIELQNTRERLKFNLELQKRLLESLNSAVAIYGVNQKLEYYNKAFIELWKLDEDWLRTYPTYGEVLESLREKRKLPEQADFASFKRDNVNMFTNLINKKEDYYYLSDGKVLKVIIIPYQNRGLLFYYEDMTSQLSLERSYNTLVSVQRYTLDNLNESVVVFGEDGKIELFNPNFLEMWNFTDSFLKSEPRISRVLDEMVAFCAQGDADDFKEGFISALHSRYPSERKIFRNDNKILLERFSPLPDGASLVTYFDITDKENVERSLRAEKLAYEEADKIKTNFLGNVSYELRSPLTSIMGFTEMLQHIYSGKLDKKSHEYLGAIHESSIRLKQLIDNIIDVSSLDAGYVSMDIKTANIGNVIDGAITANKLNADEKAISVKFKKSADINIIKADKERLQQAIGSILNFAILMGDKKSDITIQVIKIEDILRIELKYKGVGISEKDLPNIFDRFHKIHSDTAGKGSDGLQLYIAKTIIKLHDGIINVVSDKNSGTIFTIDIPYE
jgi:signal transduction histidine kinase